jgi:hypothetical protein
MAVASAVLLLGRHRRGLAEAVLQPAEALRPFALLRLDHVMFFGEDPHPLDDVRGCGDLLHRFLRIEPARGLVVAEGDEHWPGHRFCADAGFFLHAPQHEPARRRRRDVEVIAFRFVAEQFHAEPGMQPALALVVVVQPARFRSEGFFGSHHFRQLPLPGLPLARRAQLAHDHRDVDGRPVHDRSRIRCSWRP